MTFGDFAAYFPDAKFESDCLASCGNSYDPDLYLHSTASHADSFLELTAGAAIVKDPVIAASEAIEGAIKAQDGEDYVIDTKFNCDTKYDAVAIKALQNVKIEFLEIGPDKLPADDCKQAPSDSSAGATAQDAQSRQDTAAGAATASRAEAFPYIATFSCTIGGTQLSLMTCLSPDGSMEITNGNDYGLYKILDFVNHRIPNSQMTNSSLLVNLRNNFQIVAQSGRTQNVVLGVKILSTSNNQVVFQKQVDAYGVIKVSN